MTYLGGIDKHIFMFLFYRIYLYHAEGTYNQYIKHDDVIILRRHVRKNVLTFERYYFTKSFGYS